MDQPSKFTRGLQPGPLHTSQSIASKGAGVDSSSAGRSALRAAPLHTSGSAATGIAKVQRQPLIVTCDLTYQDLPDLASAKLADHWYEIALGKIGKDLDYIPDRKSVV